MEISEPEVRSTRYAEKRPAALFFFPVLVELEFLSHVAYFFFNLLVNCSMLDFVLDPEKRTV